MAETKKEHLGRVLEIRLSTRRLPQEQQFDSYRNLRGSAITPARLELDEWRSGFEADMTLRNFGPLQMSLTEAEWKMRCSVHHIRERSEIARTKNHSLIVACNLGGANSLDYRNTIIPRVEPGDWMLLSTEDRMVGSCHGPRAQQVMISIPIEAAAPLARFAGRFLGKRQSADDAANALVRDYINALSRYTMPDEKQAAAMGRNFVDLLALALNRTDEQFEASEKGVRAVLISAIDREIEAHFLDHQFCPVYAAASLRISLRYLHKLLEPTGMSFSERLVQRRLQHARELLSSSAYTQGILSVALDCGFRNAEHFSQRFRAAFGVSPSEFRGACRARRERGQAED